MRIPDESLFRDFRSVPRMTAHMIPLHTLLHPKKKPSKGRALSHKPYNKQGKQVIYLTPPQEPHKPY